MKLKHYTYKVTFPGMPWYYWGVHTDNGKPYSGSPVTNKWYWDFYEHEVQILERFETREEATIIEVRLIKHTINDPNCLNEQYGPAFTLEDCSKGGKKGGRKSAEKGHLQANAREYGLRGGAAVKSLRVGIFDPEYRNSPAYKEMRAQAASISGRIVYRCKITGYVGIRVNLIRHQKKHGVDPTPENRTVVYHPKGKV
jgi:hypothetical protein